MWETKEVGSVVAGSWHSVCRGAILRSEDFCWCGYTCIYMRDGWVSGLPSITVNYLFSAAEQDNASRLMVDSFYFEIGVYSSENSSSSTSNERSAYCINEAKGEGCSPKVLARICIILGAEETLYQKTFPVTGCAITMPKGSWVAIGHCKHRCHDSTILNRETPHLFIAEYSFLLR